MLNQGKLLIIGIVLLAFTLAGFGWWWNYNATRRSIAFWGAPAALRIMAAPATELLILGESDEASPNDERVTLDGQQYAVKRRVDVTKARGLGNIRRMLVQDQSFDWSPTSPPAPQHWDFALRFTDQQAASTVLLAIEPRLTALSGDPRIAALSETAALVLSGFIDEQIAGPIPNEAK